MPIFRLKIEVWRHGGLNEQIVEIILQIVVWSVAVALIVKLAEAVGEAVGQAGDNQFVAPGALTAAQRGCPEGGAILREQRVEFV